ncbi:hypothetical protein LJC31_08725, partial [Synergistaceae bacterium OttesenSCG-928-I11]|nr:hypothetical protein [Synergistaceae bacterium OttesenSCG-928-I11]
KDAIAPGMCRGRFFIAQSDALPYNNRQNRTSLNGKADDTTEVMARDTGGGFDRAHRSIFYKAS